MHMVCIVVAYSPSCTPGNIHTVQCTVPLFHQLSRIVGIHGYHFSLSELDTPHILVIAEYLGNFDSTKCELNKDRT